MIEIQPVLLLAGFRKALAAGGVIEIECIRDAEKIGNMWHGEWRAHVLVQNGPAHHRIALGVSRTQEPKVFKTTTSLMTFGHEHGVGFVTIPMRAGTSAEWTRDGVGKEKGSKP